MALKNQRTLVIVSLSALVLTMVLLTPPVKNKLIGMWGSWNEEESVKASPKPIPQKSRTVAQNLAELNANLAKEKQDVSPAPLATASAPPVIASVSPTPTPPKAVVAKVLPKKAPVVKPKPTAKTIASHARHVTHSARRMAKAPSKPSFAQNAGVPAPAVASAQGDTRFVWTTSTDIACDPRAGCTLAWALAQTEWPTKVTKELMKKVQGESPITIFIDQKSQWQGWFVRRTSTHTFESHAVAQFGNRTIDTKLWYVETDGKQYNLLRVSCLTWAGFTSEPMTPSKRAINSDLGVIPVAYCP